MVALLCHVPVQALAVEGQLESATLRKAAIKCQKLVAQVTAKLVAGKFKLLDACGNGALACVQTKHDELSTCLDAAAQKCAKQLDAATVGLLKAYAKIVDAKSCATDLRFPDLLSADGLGFGEIAGTCQNDFDVDICSGLPSLAECLVRSHERTAGALYGQARPRAAELLGLLPDVGLPPIDGLQSFPGCGNCSATTGNAKAVEKCGKALTKAMQGLLGAFEKQYGACARGVLACAQSPTPKSDCLTKATARCGKGAIATRAAVTKFTAAIAKACESDSVGFGEFAAKTGLNLTALKDVCEGSGKSAPTNPATLSACLQRRATCSAGELVRLSVPRTEAFGTSGAFGDLNSQLTDVCTSSAPGVSTVVTRQPRVIFGSLVKFFKSIRLHNNGNLGVRVNGGAPGPGLGAGRRVTIFGGPSRVVFGGITKIPFKFHQGKARAATFQPLADADPPTLIVTVQRDDLAFEDHFEVPLNPAVVASGEFSDELEIAYQDALPACTFTLAVTARVDGVVSEYAPLPQVADPGRPPTISNATVELVELNSGACSVTHGSLFRVTFNYADVVGAVLPSTTSIATTLHFKPSGAEGSFSAPPSALIGDGFNGTASIELCAAFNNDTDLAVTVTLSDQGGASNKLTVETPRPAGAN